MPTISVPIPILAGRSGRRNVSPVPCVKVNGGHVGIANRHVIKTLGNFIDDRPRTALLRIAERAIATFCHGPGFRDIDAEDLVQEAALRFHEQGLDVENEGAWKNTVIRHIAIDISRRAIRRRQADIAGPLTDTEGAPRAEPDPPADGPSPELLLIEKQTADRLRHAIAQLPPGQREVIELGLEDLTTKDVAQRLGIDEGTARVRRFRALKSLKRILATRS